MIWVDLTVLEDVSGNAIPHNPMGAGGFFGFCDEAILRKSLGRQIRSECNRCPWWDLDRLPEKKGGSFLYNQKHPGPQFKVLKSFTLTPNFDEKLTSPTRPFLQTSIESKLEWNIWKHLRMLGNPLNTLFRRNDWIPDGKARETQRFRFNLQSWSQGDT